MSFPSPIGRSGVGLTAGEPDAKEDAKKREPADDAWTLAISQALVEVRPRFALPGDPDPGPSDAGPGAESGAELAGAGSAELGSGDVSATEDARPGVALPERLHTELSDSRLGRMQLSVARGPSGLHIVINVADSRVKALIEAERSLLLKSLQDCGLRVDSVKIGSQPLSGTAFAQQEVAPERALARTRGSSLRSPNARWRAYTSSPEEDPDEDNERVNLTA
jgi:hypothetical protein